MALTQLHAQSPVGTFSLIPRVGATLSNITKESYMELVGTQEVSNEGKNKLGMAAGFDMQYQMMEPLAISLGAFFQQAGCTYKDTDLSQMGAGEYEVHQRARTTINYLAVPLMGHLYVSPGFSLNLGVQVAFHLNSNMHLETSAVTIGKDGSYTYTGETEKFDTKKLNVRSPDFSIPVGISYEKEHVVVDARYLFGLSKVYNPPFGNNNRNRVFILSAGYKFDIANL